MTSTKTYKGDCKLCGKKYISSNIDREVCLACAPQKNCLICGKEYNRTRGAQKFCSVKCMNLATKAKKRKGNYIIEDGIYYHLKKCGECKAEIKTRFGNVKWCVKCRRDYKDQSKAHIANPPKELFIKQLGYSIPPGAMSYIIAGMRY